MRNNNTRCRNSVGALNDAARSARNVVCIHTNRVYDECRARDNMRNLEVYFTEEGQEVIRQSLMVKASKAEIIWVYTDISPVPYNNGYYDVDVQFFFRVEFEAFRGVGTPEVVEGMCAANKKIVQFASYGNVKTFEMKYNPRERISEMRETNNYPTSSVSVVDPIIINTKVCDCAEESNNNPMFIIPNDVKQHFKNDLLLVNNGRHIYVSIGVFSIITMERDVLMRIDDGRCMPNIREFELNSEGSSARYFDSLGFPINEFIPNCDE